MYVISMFAEDELKYWHGGDIFGPHLDDAALFRTAADAENTIDLLRPADQNHDGKPALKVLERPGEQ